MYLGHVIKGRTFPDTLVVRYVMAANKAEVASMSKFLSHSYPLHLDVSGLTIKQILAVHMAS